MLEENVFWELIIEDKTLFACKKGYNCFNFKVVISDYKNAWAAKEVELAIF